MRSDLDSDLRRALGGANVTVDDAQRDALESALLAKLGPVRARRRWPRIAFGVGLGCALAVGACVMPSDYAADVGHRLAIVVDGGVDVDPKAIASFVSEHYAPDQLRMQVSQVRSRETGPDGAMAEHGGDLRIEIDAVGEHIDTDEMWDDLVEAFPELQGGRLEDEAMRMMVHGTLGGRLSHAWLDVTIDRGGIEEAKAQILRELDAQGIDENDAHVEIVDDQDEAGHHRREVRVWVEDHE